MYQWCNFGFFSITFLRIFSSFLNEGMRVTMGLKNDSLMAYNILEKRIIDSGFCTQCGACEAACPVNALHVEGEKVKHMYDCSKDMDLCPICYEICPHSEKLLLRSLSFVADAPIKNEALGYYRKIVLAQAVDSKIRKLSHGGGVVTSLLQFGIENKVFDSAIVSQGEPKILLNLSLQ